MYLNTRVAPFDDPRVRRAISYAVDRRAVKDLYPGPAKISCQLPPPNFPGYQPYCPFTLDPSLAGAWTAPDQATATRLIKESGTSGMDVTVWAHAGFADLSRYFVRLLDKLGYRARLRIVGDDSQAGFNRFYGHLADSRNKAQMGAYWTVGFPSPAEAISSLRCEAFVPNSGNNGNISEFCSQAVEGRIERALRLQTTDSAKAGAAWAAVDRHIVDQAPAIGLLVPQGVDLVSKRVGNYQNNPRCGESSSASCGSSERSRDTVGTGLPFCPTRSGGPYTVGSDRQVGIAVMSSSAAVRSRSSGSRWPRGRRCRLPKGGVDREHRCHPGQRQHPPHKWSGPDQLQGPAVR
jgi:ABC-type transport system substrate-binding protein